jgi:hypothetical protein
MESIDHAAWKRIGRADDPGRLGRACGLVAIPQDGPAFQARNTKDRERWAKVVKQGNIRVDNNQEFE